jgi:hypothetical protein
MKVLQVRIIARQEMTATSRSQSLRRRNNHYFPSLLLGIRMMDISIARSVKVTAKLAPRANNHQRLFSTVVASDGGGGVSEHSSSPVFTRSLFFRLLSASAFVFLLVLQLSHNLKHTSISHDSNPTTPRDL